MFDRVEASYRRVHPRLSRALIAFCGDAEVAGDAEAEAFSQVLRRGEEVVDVDAWVWASAFRIARGVLAQRTGTRGAVDVAGTAPESLTEFVSLLGGLSVQQRACVVLRYVGQFTPTEIASLLDTSPGTVRVQLHRAHTSLRAELSPQRGREVGS